MWRRSEGPRPLRDVLNDLRHRHQRVDFDATTQIAQVWEQVVGPAVAARCPTESLVDGVLTVRTPGGAWSARLREDEVNIVAQLSELTGSTIRALHVVIAS